MPTAKENDAERVAILHKFSFGSRTAEPAGTLALTNGINKLGTNSRNNLLEAVRDTRTFDDVDHTIGTVPFKGALDWKTGTWSLADDVLTIAVA